MDGGIEEKISSILSSPEDLKKIMEIASALGLKSPTTVEGEAREKAGTEADENVTSEETDAIEKLLKSGKSERLELLSALKPYLKDAKRDKIDNLLKLINTAELIMSAKKFL